MMLDTNIVIDLTAGGEDDHAEASLRCFARHAARHAIFINHIVYAEVVPRVSDRAGFDEHLSHLGIRVVAMDGDDAWRAGLAFRDYRNRGAPRLTILPDFLIGGHAANRGWPIMTRDSKRFQSYFPEIEVIDPTQASND